MSENTKSYFTTGEFANICQVNKRTLFHYDDIGLFQPAITNEKGYRFYAFNQIDVFLIISMLKELDVPLKQIKEYLDERTPERLIDLSRQKITEIDSKIEKLGRIKHLLEETIVFTNKGLQVNPEEIILEEQNEEYLIRSDLLKEENLQDYIRWMSEFSNFSNRTLSKDTSFAGTMLSIENIVKGNYYSNSYFFVKTSDSNLSNEIKPKGLYAVAYHSGNYDTIGNTYERLTDYCRKNKLSMGGFSYEESLLDNTALKNDTNYIMQLTIEVSQIKEGKQKIEEL
jgi:Predicted transcriptional regulators